jgi:hypothetical protein
LVEQYTFNVWVLGSSPSGITETKVKRHQSRSSYITRAAFLFLGNSYRLKQTQTFCEYSVNRTFLDCEPQLF